MKRISVLTMCVILGLSLAGCGNTEAIEKEAEPVTESVTETAEIQEDAEEETTVKEKVSETDKEETKKAEETATMTTTKAEKATEAQTTAKSTSKNSTTKASTTKKPSSSKATTSKAKSTTSKSTTKASTTKAAATKKKGLSYDDVMWVQKKTNEYIVSKGIQYSEEVGSWSGYESSSGSGITSKEILLEREKDWVDTEYEDCIKSGYKTVAMYCRVEKQSSGSYYLYIVYG